MKELGITKGEWKTDNIAIKSNNKLIATVVEQDMYNKDVEGIANAKLIADAGTTANKCNLLPSELLDRYNEAIEVLEELLNYYTEEVKIPNKKIALKVEQTISKAKGE